MALRPGTDYCPGKLSDTDRRQCLLTPHHAWSIEFDYSFYRHTLTNENIWARIIAELHNRRLPDTRSVSAGLELQPKVMWLPRGKAVVVVEPPPTVNQPGQDPCHICL
jgi:hypothetical protein